MTLGEIVEKQIQVNVEILVGIRDAVGGMRCWLEITQC